VKEQRKLAAIMFTDIVGYTALMSKDEQHAHQIIHKSRDLLKALVEQYNGECLQTVGDETLSSFASVVDAVNCALEIQRSFRDDPEINLRVGIHIGDVVFDGDEIYGDGVNVASRLQALAEPGGICISGKVYSEIRNKPGMEAVFLGEKTLKNVDLPMKVYAITVEPPSAALPETSVDKKTEPVPAKKPTRRILVALAGMIVIILGLYTVYSRYLAVPATAPGEKQIKSIAVLPFVNMSPDKDQEYFCDGLAEELLNMLARVKGLRVIARTSSFAFKGEKVDIATIGEKLDVESVLEGSVRKADHMVRITTQLINVSDRSHLWSETYDRRLDDIFAVQEEISRQVVGALKVTLLAEDESELSGRPTENIQAYDLYLLGRHHLNASWRLESVEKAIDFFSRAIDLDPEYALAYAGLAEAYIRQSRATNVPRNQAIESAEKAATRALALDSLLAEAHAAFGLVKDWQYDYPTAEAAFIKAIELNPNYMQTYGYYAHLMNVLGRYKDAITLVEQGLEIDPLSQELRQNFNWNLLNMGRIEELEYEYKHMAYWMYGPLAETFKRTLKQVEADPANSTRYWLLADGYLDLGEYELAEKSLARVRELAPESIHESKVDYYIYLVQGRYKQCLQYAYDRLSKDPDNAFNIHYAALAEMLVGNYEKALTLYESARLAYNRVGIPFGLEPYFINAYGKAFLVYIAYSYIKTGEHEKGQELLAESRAFLDKLREQGLGTPPSYYFEASLNALGGNRQQALASLRKAIDLGWRRSWYAKIDPPMESLRDTPEFKQMMAEVDADIARQREQLKQEGLLK
jgi:adenylate cyclase